MRENSLRQQPREFTTRRRKRTVVHSPRVRADIQEHTWKGMSTESNTGVQTRAMAQRVDNEANPEQLHRAMDPAMNPTVELHRTKEDAIGEFV